MKNLRDTFRDMTPDEMREASREAEIAEWRESNRFCGRCGAEMKPHDDPGERALVCAKCGVREFYGGGWMKEPGKVITCCNDGLRPVYFKLEATDREAGPFLGRG